MPLAASALIAPTGPLEPSLFPTEDSNQLAARVQAYLTAAYGDARVDAIGNDDDEQEALQDSMAMALVLYKAYSAVYQRMLNEPNTVNIAEKGGHAYTDKQREAMKAIADSYLAEFLALVPPAVGATGVRPGTTSVPTHFRW